MIETLVDTLLELSSFFEKGGPYAVISVFFYLYLMERRSNAKKGRDILKLAMAAVKQQTKYHALLSNLKDVLHIELTEDTEAEEGTEET